MVLRDFPRATVLIFSELRKFRMADSSRSKEKAMVVKKRLFIITLYLFMIKLYYLRLSCLFLTLRGL